MLDFMIFINIRVYGIMNKFSSTKTAYLHFQRRIYCTINPKAFMPICSFIFLYTAWNMREYGLSRSHILPYKDKIKDFVLIRDNTGQWETRISRMFYALSTSIFNVWRSLNFSFSFNFPRLFALSVTLRTSWKKSNKKVRYVSARQRVKKSYKCQEKL